MEHSLVTETVKQVQSQLDQRNAEALQELNKQIDELSSLPLSGQLPPYNDTLDLESPPFGFQDSSPVKKDFSSETRTYQDIKTTIDGNFVSEVKRNKDKVSFSVQDDSFYDAALNRMTQDTEALFARAEMNSEEGSPKRDDPIQALFNRINEGRNDVLKGLDDPIRSSRTASVGVPLPTHNRSNETENGQYANGGYSAKFGTDYQSRLPVDTTNYPRIGADNASYQSKLPSDSGIYHSKLPSDFTNYQSRLASDAGARVGSDYHSKLDAELHAKLDNDAMNLRDSRNKAYDLNLTAGLDFKTTYEKEPFRTSILDTTHDSHDLKRISSSNFNTAEPYRPMSAIPSDVNSRAVVNALRTLQDRVGKLEGEKVSAKEKITELEKELSATRKLLFHQQQVGTPPTKDLPPKDVNPSFLEATINEAADSTLQKIAEAREQVSKLQERVEQVQNLSVRKDKPSVKHSQIGTETHALVDVGTSPQKFSNHSPDRQNEGSLKYSGIVPDASSFSRTAADANSQRLSNYSPDRPVNQISPQRANEPSPIRYANQQSPPRPLSARLESYMDDLDISLKNALPQDHSYYLDPSDDKSTKSRLLQDEIEKDRLVREKDIAVTFIDLERRQE